MVNISLILDIVKDIRNTIHDFQAQQNAMNSRVTQIESTLKDMDSKISNHQAQLDSLCDKDKKIQGVAIFFGFMIPIAIAILGIIF